MKKYVVLIAALTLLAVKNFAQNEKFQMAMGKALGQFQAAKTADDYKNTANIFARIANAEPNEWLPKYYAANCRLLADTNCLRTYRQLKRSDFCLLSRQLLTFFCILFQYFQKVDWLVFVFYIRLQKT